MTSEPKNTARASAIKDRGIIYLAVFRELSERFGEAEAISVMRSASRAHGVKVGETLKHLAPRDFEGLLNGYFKCPDGGATFGTETRQLDENCLEVQVKTCPLKQSWVESGCSDAEVCTLLRCATAFDEAVFETAGFGYELEMWSPGKKGCCRTRIFEKS